jgi:ParB-like nuclease domain
MTKRDATAFNWRDHLAVHPAADLFPLMSETDDPQALKELAEDIRKNGLQSPIIVWRKREGDADVDCLIDGRNRLDALAMLGWLGPKRKRDHRLFAPPLSSLRSAGSAHAARAARK